MAQRHGRADFHVTGEGIYELGSMDPAHVVEPRAPTAIEEIRKFRFSRMADKGPQLPVELLRKLAIAMVADQSDQPDSEVPAGFTYLGQFIDHDLTFDKTIRALGEDVSVQELLQGRSPSLDLDCLYGRGPEKDPHFYSDGVHLKVGTTTATAFPEENAKVKVDLRGFDLPRQGFGSLPRDRRQPFIADIRNDENLVVAQTHAAFIRFHNCMVDDLALQGVGLHVLFEKARAEVVRHYQWVIRHDFLPRILDQSVLENVFDQGRRYFEVGTPAGDETQYQPNAPGGDVYGSMPIEFSVAAYRLGHSMVRPAYEWNSVFNTDGPGGAAGLQLLFNFTGTSGTLSPLPRTRPEPPAPQPEDPDFGSFERLPTNWIADWRRLYDFEQDADMPGLAPPGHLNRARRIDTLLADPLRELPPRSFGRIEGKLPADMQPNLAFRNLIRGRMVSLASGQQLATLFEVPPLEQQQIIEGQGGAQLELSEEEAALLCADTPLWFYLLREAEVNGGRMGPVGSRIVAETFHRAIETSRESIVRDPNWRPSRGPTPGIFKAVHLLLFAFGPQQLSPI